MTPIVEPIVVEMMVPKVSGVVCGTDAEPSLTTTIGIRADVALLKGVDYGKDA